MTGIPCPHCGREHTRAGAKFCEHCGGDLRDAIANARAAERAAAAEDPAPADAAAPASLSVASSNGTVEEIAPEDGSIEDIEIRILDDGEPAPSPHAPPAPRPVVAAPPPVVAVPEPSAPREQPAPQPPARPGAQEQPKDRRAPKGYAARRAQETQRRSSPASVVALVIIIGLILGAVWTAYLRAQGRGAEERSRTRTASTSPAGAVPASPRPAPTPPIGATLKVTTVPTEARVELDGKVVGTTRLTLTGLRPGAHKIKISKTGYRTVAREFNVVMMETITLDLTLTPVAARPALRNDSPPPPPPPPP
jgi:hypothetical protein